MSGKGVDARARRSAFDEAADTAVRPLLARASRCSVCSRAPRETTSRRCASRGRPRCWTTWDSPIRGLALFSRTRSARVELGRYAGAGKLLDRLEARRAGVDSGCLRRSAAVGMTCGGRDADVQRPSLEALRYDSVGFRLDAARAALGWDVRFFARPPALPLSAVDRATVFAAMWSDAVAARRRGARPCAPPRRDFTAAERRVARLRRRPKKTDEIGQALFWRPHREAQRPASP